MQKKETKKNAMDYRYATLSVLSQKRGKTGACPDPEDLAAFSEGRLKGRQHKAIMAHLNDCASCRRHWLLVESTLEEMNVHEAAWIEKIARKLKNIKSRHAFAGGGLGLALATCLLLVFVVPQQSELSKMISNSYGSLSPADIARYSSFVSRGGEEDSEIPASDALLAYKAGLAVGKAMLLSQTESLKKKDAAKNLHTMLYYIGQWAVVLQCACIASGPALDDFWSEQEAIAIEMQNELKKIATGEIEGGEIVKTVTIIQSTIKQIQETGGRVDGCEEIALALDGLKNKLRLRFKQKR